ncbi:hypothetical protein D9M71_573310 [compost metagenome]
MPADAAGPFFKTSATTTPICCFGANTSSCVGGTRLMPNHPRTTRPSFKIEFNTCWQILAGIAKPIPKEPPDCEKIAVFTPIKLPATSINAPPELPGLIAASV